MVKILKTKLVFAFAILLLFHASNCFSKDVVKTSTIGLLEGPSPSITAIDTIAPFDTTVSISIKGADTTKTISIHRKIDYKRSQDDLATLTGAVTSLAVIAGISLVGSLVLIIVTANK